MNRIIKSYNASQVKERKRICDLLMKEIDKQLPAAEKCLRHAIALDARHVRALYRLGVLYREMGRRDDAKNQFRHVRDLDPHYQGSLE